MSDNLPEQLHQPVTAVGRPYGGSNSAALDADDILIPRMKLAQLISRVVSDRLVDYGAVYVSTSREDMEPEVIAPAPKGKDSLGDEVRFYVHGDPRKGWSWRQPDGQLGRGTSYPNLALVKDHEPRNVSRTYDYLVTLPAYPLMPVRFLMHGKWGGTPAKYLNTQLLLARQQGLDSSEVAFKLQTRLTSNPKNGMEQPFVAAVVGKADVKAKDREADLDLVRQHVELIGSAANVRELDDEDVQAAPAPDTPDLG